MSNTEDSYQKKLMEQAELVGEYNYGGNDCEACCRVELHRGLAGAAGIIACYDVVSYEHSKRGRLGALYAQSWFTVTEERKAAVKKKIKEIEDE